MINGHGDDSHCLNVPIRADFSSNVWFEGTPPELICYLQQKLHLIGNYPEPDAAGLCQGIANFHEVNSEQVLAFNGSVEAFYTVALAFRKAVSAILYPAFSEYGDACRLHRHVPSFFRSDEAKQALNSGANLFWIGTPNNPDGHFFSFREIVEWLNRFPNTIFVIDEAYAAFIPDFQSVIPLTQKYPNLIVIRSLTKCCAIPGLRLGYVVTSAKLAERLRKFQQPWSVNALAQEAGKFLMEHLKVHSFDAQSIQQLSMKLQQSIGEISGFKVIPAKTPYFLVEMQLGTAAELKKFLVQEHGILIRDASNFNGLDERYFRVCTRNESDNQLLIDGLKSYTQWK
ncbi:L-threonine 3-O-phosphate decarboxylase [Aquipluma nitroreducens]|uniref:Aminotransferase n=1 Tax=Aquipluma nitroreducens TaxID=2010828 RepID=A0A5K7SAH7_9BACT|nr:aminotransferase class I/II-fold pyridoxal phosphate-dependent enzyme [Aquipluma nitroreducens]BBE18294.1 L-threonine 3-O-phosphate decarboxylase [Aquipluma nitroreducens]